MTIKQKTAVVDVEGGSRIEVRRMRWKDAREFFKKLAALVSTVYGGKSAPGAPATADPVGAQVPDSSFTGMLFKNLPDIVAGSDELVAMLCTKSTDLSADKFDDLDQATAFAVLHAALEVNYDDELKNCLAGIGAKLATLLPAKGKTN